MVVTRKPSNPLPPPAVPSRTPSTSGSSSSATTSKGRSSSGTGSVKTSSPLVNGISADGTRGEGDSGENESGLPSERLSAPPGSRLRLKKGATVKPRYPPPPPPPRQSTRLISLSSWLVYGLLAVLGFYTFLNCPNDYLLDNPVCKGLSIYRQHVLEPVVLPPIKYISQHPYVAPKLEKIQPIVQQSREVVGPYVDYGRQTWSQAVVPFWRTQLLPRALLIKMRIQPLLEDLWRRYVAAVYPLFSKARDRYIEVAHPYILVVQQNAVSFQQKANPYFQQGYRGALQGYRLSEPYLILIWRQAQQIPGFLLERIYLPSLKMRRLYVDPHVTKGYVLVSTKGGEYRRFYVDRHVKRMWMTVQDLAMSRITSKKTSTSSASVVYHKATPVDPTSESMDPEPTPTTADIAMEHVLAEETTEADDTEASPIDVAEPSAEQIPGASETETTSPMSSTSSSTIPEAIPTMSQSPDEAVAEPTPVIAAETPTPEPSVTPEEGDVDSFLSDLGIDEEVVIKEATEIVPEDDEPPPLTEEEIARQNEELMESRKVATAEKRASIMTVFLDFEERLRVMVAELNETFHTDLIALRATIKDELEAASLDQFSAEKLNAEGTRALKNTQQYLKSLIMDEKKTAAEKDLLWEKVLTRVEEKFTQRVQGVEAEIRVWWDNGLVREGALIKERVAKLVRLGDLGQANLGMDLAWLDDVDTHDWARYNALVDVAKEQEKVYLSISEGSSPSSLPNPAMPLIIEIQNDLRDIIDGFEARLNTIQHDGYDAISEASQTSSTEGDDIAILPVPEDDGKKAIHDAEAGITGRTKEQVEAALNIASALSSSGADVSILPVPDPVETEEARKETENAEAILLSRSKKEVEEALKMAAASVASDLPDVSILPIPKEAKEAALEMQRKKAEHEAAMGILSRAEEEVEAALQRAAELEGDHSSSQKAVEDDTITLGGSQPEVTKEPHEESTIHLL